MLSLVSLADVAQTSVVPSRMGALLGRVQMPVPRGHVKELAGPAGAAAQPAAARLFGNGTRVAGLAISAGQQPISKVNYAHTTRIAALKGCGALGPHPARDPV